MSLFLSEAFLAGLKEGLKLLAVWLVFASAIKGRDSLIKPFYIGIALALALSAVLAVSMPAGEDARAFILRLTGYVFFVFFLSSVIALYQAWGTNLFGHLRLGGTAVAVITVALSAFYFLPDFSGSAVFIQDLSVMRASPAGAYLSASLGFVLPIAISFVLPRRLGGFISGYFGMPQLLLFLSVVKLISGGIKGVAEFSMIPMVQAGLMKFFHDVIHQTFVFLMVPDHPMLKLSVWNFIGIFFGSNIAIATALVILLTPPLIFLYQSFFAPITGISAETGAERRMLKSVVRADRRKKAIPVAFFVSVILFMWYSVGGEQAGRLYNPSPKPVISDKGQIVIPFTDPTMNLLDGRIHKFALIVGDKTMRLLVVRKPDKSVSVCLDACEICAPAGYGQTEGHVVCIYCKTPIPLSTLGRPGGCNPIPLRALISDIDIRIDVSEIALKWKDVQSVKSGEGKP